MLIRRVSARLIIKGALIGTRRDVITFWIVLEDVIQVLDVFEGIQDFVVNNTVIGIVCFGSAGLIQSDPDDLDKPSRAVLDFRLIRRISGTATQILFFDVLLPVHVWHRLQNKLSGLIVIVKFKVQHSVVLRGSLLLAAIHLLDSYFLVALGLFV